MKYKRAWYVFRSTWVRVWLGLRYFSFLSENFNCFKNSASAVENGLCWQCMIGIMWVCHYKQHVYIARASLPKWQLSHSRSSGIKALGNREDVGSSPNRGELLSISEYFHCVRNISSAIKNRCCCSRMNGISCVNNFKQYTYICKLVS